MLTQATTANATMVTGAKKFTKRMEEDGWKKVAKGRIEKKGRSGSRERNRRVLEVIHGNRGKGGKGKGREREG